MPLAHFYHLYAGGPWRHATWWHATSIRHAGLHVTPRIGVTGPEAVQAPAWLDLQFPGNWALTAYTREGWEQVTLIPLARWARQQTEDTAVLYAHTKGCANITAPSQDWRNAMTRAVIGHWQQCVDALAKGAHAAGPSWEQDGWPHFPGNFWWARTAYLATLPDPGTEYRGQAETWIGLGNPRTAVIHPGPIP